MTAPTPTRFEAGAGAQGGCGDDGEGADRDGDGAALAEDIGLMHVPKLLLVLVVLVGAVMVGRTPTAEAHPADWNGVYGATEYSCPGVDLAIRVPTLNYDDCRNSSMIILEDRPRIFTLMIADLACSKRGWVLQLTGEPAADVRLRAYRSLDAINKRAVDFECRYRRRD